TAMPRLRPTVLHGAKTASSRESVTPDGSGASAAFRSFAQWYRVCRRLHLARDHHLGRLDDGDGVVAAAQFQLVNGVAGDDGRQRLIADPQSHLAEQAVNADLLHIAAQTITTTEGDDKPGGGRRPGDGRAGWLPPRCQAVDF